MNFKQAKAKLKRLAKGKYHSLGYKITEHEDGEITQECRLYIDSLKYYDGGTWEAAFKKLNLELNPPPKKPVEIDNIEEIKKIN